MLFVGMLLGATPAPAQDLAPRLLFSGPRVRHYAYVQTFPTPCEGCPTITYELQFKKPGGDTAVLLTSTHALMGTNRILFPTSGKYEFILHKSWMQKEMQTGIEHLEHTYDVLSSTNIDNLAPQPITGAPAWDETFISDQVSEVKVRLAEHRTLSLTDVDVLGEVQVSGGTNEVIKTWGSLYMTGGTVYSNVVATVDVFTMEGTLVTRDAGAMANRAYFSKVNVKGSLNTSPNEGSVVTVAQCEASYLDLNGGQILAERSRLTGLTGLSRVQGKTASVVGCFFRDDAVCTGTELLRLSGNDFYGECGVNAPPGTLYLVNNVFVGTLRYDRPLTGTENLSITGNSFLNPYDAAVLGPVINNTPTILRKYRLDSNYWGDPSGPDLLPSPGDNWLRPVRGSCGALSLETTWLNSGSENVSGLVEPDLEPELWVNRVRCGQNVFSSTYQFARTGRRTLISFDLRTTFGTRQVNDLYLQVGTENLARVPSAYVAQRSYPAGATARTLDFILPPQSVDRVSFTLVRQQPNGGFVPFSGPYSITLRGAPARPLRIGLKLMTINAWGYREEFNQVVRPDRDTSTVFQDTLTTAMAALLPLRKREDIRIEMLPSAEYSPLVTGLLPWRHNSVYFGLARQLQTELDRENATRTQAQRPPLDFLVAVLPSGDLSGNTGSTGFNHPWYPRVAVIEETEPAAAIHEFGHGFGLYGTEQYNLPGGWQQSYGFDIFVDNTAGARVWGASLFVPDEGLTYQPLGNGILHCPPGVNSGLRDVMGAIAADAILPGTHQRFVEGLYGLLGEGVTPPAARAASASATAAGGPATGTRRMVMECLVQTVAVDGIPRQQFVRGTTVCRLAPPGQELVVGTEPLNLRMKAFNTSGTQVGMWDCRRQDRAEPEAFKWSQTFDVPESAVRYELETSSWTSGFLDPIPGDWPPHLKVTSLGAGAIGSPGVGGSTLGACVDLEFGLAGEPPLGRPLGITLLVSADGGGSYQYFGDFDGMTSVRIWRDSLPVSEALLFKVMVSDGFQSRESVAGPYRRAATGLSVEVAQPWAGAVASEATPWTLVADIGGTPELAEVRWSSSRDGALGIGQSLPGVNLSLGVHRLTCTAKDTAGKATAATLDVTVISIDATNLDWQVQGDALSLAIAGRDPTLGRVQRPQTGRNCEATVILRSPGIAATAQARLYYQPPGEPELLLADQVLHLPALATASVSGTFLPVGQGVHRLRAEILPSAAETLTDTNLSNNQWTWAFTNLPPVALGMSLQTAAGEAIDFQLPALDPDGDPLTYEVTGAPAHGRLTGEAPALVYTPETNYTGTDALVFRVFDGLQWSAATTALMTIRPAGPSLPRVMNVTGKAGQPLQYLIPATGENLSFSAPMLPWMFDGLTLAPKTGVLSGTPSSPQTEAVTVNVTNAAGRAQGMLRIAILTNAAAPEITSALEAGGGAGFSFSYQITAQDNPQIYLSSNLPPYLVLNEFNGVISGTPLNAGVYLVGIGASNSFGASWKTLTLTVNSSGQPPTFAYPLDTSAEVGKPFAYDLGRFCGNNPLHWEITSLPAGLSIDPGSGRISGTPLAAGFYSPTVTARNVAGQTSLAFVLEVRTPPGVPVLIHPGSLSGTVGRDFQCRIQASGIPTSYAATGLPANLAVDPQTGLISGKPTAAGNFRALLFAANAAGTGGTEVTFVIMPNAGVPLIGAAVFNLEKLGGAFDFQPIVLNSAAGFTATGLPRGLSIDPATGRISGRFEKAGRYVVTLVATNAFGAGSAQLHLRATPNLEGWLLVAGLTGERSLAAADPDGDGLPNLVEYAFDSDPTTPRQEPLVRVRTNEGGQLVLVYKAWSEAAGNLLTDYQAGGVRYELETSTSVTGPWVKNANVFDANVSLTEATDGTQQLAIPLHRSADEPSRFVRLRISQP